MLSNQAWSRMHRFMRTVHLYSGLLLVPWMAMYATSAFCLNHSRWFTPWLGKPQSFDALSAFHPGQ